MEFSEFVPLGQTIVLIGGGVWAVANIKAMTTSAAEKIVALKDVIDDLKGWIIKVEDRTNEHAEKIARLEAHNDNGRWRNKA